MPKSLEEIIRLAINRITLEWCPSCTEEGSEKEIVKFGDAIASKMYELTRRKNVR